MRKKRVLIHSNYCGLKTGFGGFVREMLTYLYKTDKYELFLYAGGITWEHPEYVKWPWTVYGALPNNPKEIEFLNRDPNLARAAAYGDYQIDKVIKEVKPDIYFGVEDPWGVAYCKDKAWWNKITCVVHSTIDSRPLLPAAVELAKKTEHFYCWADFATQDFQKIGLNHVKTMRGTVNTRTYRRLPSEQRKRLREFHKIPENAFCVGMLSRNQLRKSFPTLIQGYKMFRDANPEVKDARLLLFTHYGEGWNIPDRIKEYGVNPDEVLACYKCRATGQYFLLPYKGQDLDNPIIKTCKKSLVTVNMQDGVTDEQVNEWYNMLDVYAHPFTSGGQERSIQEAKLAELVTLVTNYSCGEDSCVEEAASLPLKYAEYREQGTEFIKAATSPASIAQNLKKFFNMSSEKRRDMGRMARAWVLDNFSIEKIGAQYEELIDTCPLTEYDFDIKEESKNPNAAIPESSDDRIWVKSLYKEILNMDVDDNDDGLKSWLKQLDNHAPRPDVENYFRRVAVTENQKHSKSVDLEDLLGDEPPTERVLINIPESVGDCYYITALLPDARELYKGKKIYVATKKQYKEIFEPLVGRLIDGVIEWLPEFDDSMSLEGYGTARGYFSVVLQPHFPTQRMINYLHHGEKTTNLRLRRGVEVRCGEMKTIGKIPEHSVYVGDKPASRERIIA